MNGGAEPSAESHGGANDDVEPKPQQKSVPQFLAKLYQMCNADISHHQGCLAWNDGGDSFAVSNAELVRSLLFFFVPGHSLPTPCLST